MYVFKHEMCEINERTSWGKNQPAKFDKTDDQILSVILYFILFLFIYFMATKKTVSRSYSRSWSKIKETENCSLYTYNPSYVELTIMCQLPIVHLFQKSIELLKELKNGRKM